MSPAGSHPDIGDFVHIIMHHTADAGVHQDGVHSCPDPVHDNGIAAVLKIQIPADIVHNNEILTNTCIQMSNGLMKPQRMKSALFRVRDQPLHIFQGAGDLCLAVPLQNRDIDQKVDILYAFTYFQLHSPAVFGYAPVLLSINKRYAIFF